MSSPFRRGRVDEPGLVLRKVIHRTEKLVYSHQRVWGDQNDGLNRVNRKNLGESSSWITPTNRDPFTSKP